jgi:hypothetical protein
VKRVDISALGVSNWDYALGARTFPSLNQGDKEDVLKVFSALLELSLPSRGLLEVSLPPVEAREED